MILFRFHKGAQGKTQSMLRAAYSSLRLQSRVLRSRSGNGIWRGSRWLYEYCGINQLTNLDRVVRPLVGPLQGIFLPAQLRLNLAHSAPPQLSLASTAYQDARAKRWRTGLDQRNAPRGVVSSGAPPSRPFAEAIERLNIASCGDRVCPCCIACSYLFVLTICSSYASIFVYRR